MKGFCVALGLFDCVHKGHRKVLEEALSIAEGNDLTAAAVTFDDESLGLLHKTQIYNLSTRKLLMQSVGIKEIFAYRFDEKLKKVAAIDFLKELARKGAKHFVFGYDYSCGSDRKTGKQVAKICNEIGVKSTIVPVLMIDGEKISSSRISKLLLDGNINAANAMLGQPFFISGTVIHGREVGRKMGFPTANVSYDGFTPKFGVYKTITSFDGKIYAGLTNIGSKPTFGIEAPSIENTLIGFDGDLYGKVLSIKFIGFLRPLIKFDSMDKLKLQIQKDMEDAKC